MGVSEFVFEGARTRLIVCAQVLTVIGPGCRYDLGTVRGKEARQRLVAQACPTCFKYFSAFGESDEEVFRKIQETCRHRSTAVNAGVR